MNEIQIDNTCVVSLKVNGVTYALGFDLVLPDAEGVPSSDWCWLTNEKLMRKDLIDHVLVLRTAGEG